MTKREFKAVTPKAKSGGGTVIGIVIGLVLGLVIAVVVAFMLNKGPKPFADKTGGGVAKTAPKGASDSSDPNKPLYGKDAKAGDAAKAGAAGEAKRFSFYEILPGKEEVIDARKAQEVAKVDPKAVEKKAGADVKGAEAKPHTDGKAASDGKHAPAPDDAKSASRDHYFLQAGAFAAAGDADNQKAKLALMGFEAKVETVDVEGKGTMHRVRLGPYGRLDDINRVRSTLASNGVDAALIRLKDAPK